MTETVTPVDHAMGFVQTVFKPFKLDWRLMDPLTHVPGVRLKGTSQGAAVDVVCNRGKVKLISMALRLAPESTLLMVHILACIRADVAHTDADA